MNTEEVKGAFDRYPEFAQHFLDRKVGFSKLLSKGITRNEDAVSKLLNTLKRNGAIKIYSQTHYYTLTKEGLGPVLEVAMEYELRRFLEE